MGIADFKIQSSQVHCFVQRTAFLKLFILSECVRQIETLFNILEKRKLIPRLKRLLHYHITEKYLLQRKEKKKRRKKILDRPIPSCKIKNKVHKN